MSGGYGERNSEGGKTDGDGGKTVGGEASDGGVKTRLTIVKLVICAGSP